MYHLWTEFGPCKECYQRIAREMICKLTPELWGRPQGGQLGETGQKALQTAWRRAARAVVPRQAGFPLATLLWRVSGERRRLAAHHHIPEARRGDGLTVVWLPVRRREGNLPEHWKGLVEFQWSQESLGAVARRSRDARAGALTCTLVGNFDFGIDV